MSPSPEALQQRYSSIEQIYAEQNWPEVERQSQQLLADLPDDPRDPLRQRLVLLLAHTRLYGSGDAEAAGQLYGAVAAADPEPALLEIAQQGLAQCEALRPPNPQPVVEQTAAAAAAAMPWLQELGGGAAAQLESAPPVQQQAPFQAAEPLPVEVVEEPEQIEVALADPERLELVTLEPNEAAPAETAQPGATDQDPAKPLRWPFMAGYVERRLEGQIPEDPQPELEPELLDAATGVAASQPEEPLPPVAVTTAEPAPLPVGFSPEELQELSRGLLRVEFS